MRQNEIIDQYLTIEAFNQWLASQDADAVVGEAGRPTYCPMANYLFAKTGGCRTVFVLDLENLGPIICFGATLDEPALHVAAPIWVQSFAGRIDGSSADTGDYEVTASQALEALNAVRSGVE